MKRLMGMFAVVVVGGMMINQVAGAGAVDGPQIKDASVAPGGTDTFVISFSGGEDAEVALNGDGPTNLELYVYDEAGNLVAADLTGSDVPSVVWHPTATEKFVIKIINRDSVTDDYQLITN